MPGGGTGVDQAHFADRASADHGARLADHRVARVTVGEAEQSSGSFAYIRQSFGFIEVMSEGFLADDVDAALEETFGYREVQPWRRRDNNDIDSIWPGSLLLEHFSPVGIDPIRREQFLAPRDAWICVLRCGGQRPKRNLLSPSGSAGPLNRVDDLSHAVAVLKCGTEWPTGSPAATAASM